MYSILPNKEIIDKLINTASKNWTTKMLTKNPDNFIVGMRARNELAVLYALHETTKSYCDELLQIETTSSKKKKLLEDIKTSLEKHVVDIK